MNSSLDTYPTMSYPVPAYPYISYPDTSYPDTSYPDTSYPDTSYPDTSYQDVSYPYFIVPDVSYPNVYSTEMTYPDTLLYPHTPDMDSYQENASEVHSTLSLQEDSIATDNFFIEIPETNFQEATHDLDPFHQANIGKEFHGTLYKWVEDKSFGFIKCPVLNKDIFVHYSNLGMPDMPIPSEVTFILDQDKKSKRLKAVDVKTPRTLTIGMFMDSVNTGKRNGHKRSKNWIDELPSQNLKSEPGWPEEIEEKAKKCQFPEF